MNAEPIFTNDRLRLVGKRMRGAFFDEFGPPDTFPDSRVAVAALASLHMGEVIQALACGNPPENIRAAMNHLVDLFVETNRDELAEVFKRGDAADVLRRSALEEES